MAGHGIAARTPVADSLLSAANQDPGLFGRMFRLPALVVSDAALESLAAAMKNAGPTSNPSIPAGFTYLGQFIDHDITLDLTSLGDQAADPEAFENFRTPSLDLDSVYGLGPDGSPHLYARDPNTLAIGPKLLIGTAAKSPALVVAEDIPEMPGFDLPRRPETGTAIIGDPRNDENLMVAQTHVAFLRFHNAVVDLERAKGVPEKDLFEAARRKVRWHYQWMVLHEFLDKITGETGIAARIMRQGRRFYRFQRFPWMPVEFSVAAYRFGHSLVRGGYSHNRVFRPGGATVATLQLLFEFTAKSGKIVGNLVPPGNPLPAPVLPSNWVVDWRRFFDFGTPPETPAFEFNAAERLDPFLTGTLHTLPGFGAGPQANLAFRNLKRGVKMLLPSGQQVARAMHIMPMTPEQIASGPDGAAAKQHGRSLNA